MKLTPEDEAYKERWGMTPQEEADQAYKKRWGIPYEKPQGEEKSTEPADEYEEREPEMSDEAYFIMKTFFGF